MMMHKRMIMLVVCFLFFVLIACSSQDAFPVLKGPYLGQKPPGMTPEIFAPDILSKDNLAFGLVFTPDGNELYFKLFDPVKDIGSIMCMKRVNNIWTKPEVAPFSGTYFDLDMSISHDGYRFFFRSNRPFPGSNKLKDRFYIWYMIRIKDGWSEPRPLDFSGNINIPVGCPTITFNGTLYFTARLDGTIGGSDVYRSRFVNGSYVTPENLGSTINSKYNENNMLIAPDESYMIVACNGRPENIGEEDLYIGFRKSNGSWTTLKNMGKAINTKSDEKCPVLSPDGKYLFFIRYKLNVDACDIYWVDAKVIEELKPDYLK